MVCQKCGYHDPKEKQVLGIPLCTICSSFAPSTQEEVLCYINEKLDWKILETFRRFKTQKEENKTRGMEKSAQKGKHQNRPPLGYNISKGKLTPNEDALKVHRIFVGKSKGKSLTELSKEFNLSINGIKKILNNRTYLGEIQFNGKTYKGNHKAIIDEDLWNVARRRD
jgi:site-specific DNA recombinase